MSNGTRFISNGVVASLMEVASRSAPSSAQVRRVVAVGIVLAVCAVLLTAETALAKPKQVKVRVYNATGGKLANAEVHVYPGTASQPLWCKCENDVCEVDPEKQGTTGKSGRVRITGLSANTDYTIAVGDKCELKPGFEFCTCPDDCDYKPGTSKTIRTNSSGGSSETVELQP